MVNCPRIGFITLMVFTCAGMSLAQSRPSEKIVGWRGDGTGRYPDAKPPTEWYLNDKGAKNILWKTKLPCYSWATPVIVGDKVITRSDPYDLICLDKNTGKLLWIRSHPPIEGLTAEEKKANPAFKEVESLVTDLQKVNDEFVKQGWTKELYKQKYDLQKKINSLTAKIDKKYELPPDVYCESWTGYTSQTPCSDGEGIYFASAVGVTARYDLNGNKNWAHYEQFSKATFGEHGQCGSPTLYKDMFLVPMKPTPGNINLVVFDKKTGTERWRSNYKGNVNHGCDGDWATVMPFELGGKDYAITWGHVVNLKDGASYYQLSFYDATPVLQDNVAYFSGDSGSATWLTLEAQANGGLKVSPAAGIKFPLTKEADRWNPMENYYSASPLLYQGLLYLVSNWGNLVVVDAKKGDIVYQKKMPFDFKNPKARRTFGMGMGASPALAGKYIYMIDSAGCTIVMEPGREYKQVAKNSIDYTVLSEWEPFHYAAPHHEQTEASPIFEGGRIYIRGEQFLYCIGEK